MAPNATLSADVQDVVDHARSESISANESITPETVYELVAESAFALGIELDPDQRAEARHALIDTPVKRQEC